LFDKRFLQKMKFYQQSQKEQSLVSTNFPCNTITSSDNIFVLLPATHNSHPMVTHAKARIHKLKLFQTSYTDDFA